MTDKETLNLLRGLIKEVKMEAKSKVLKENKTPIANKPEEALLKEYIVGNTMKIILDSE